MINIEFSSPVSSHQVRRLLAISLLATAALALALGVAAAEQIQVGNLIINVDGGFKPTALPKKTFAPISLSVRGDIKTVDGSFPTAVSRVVVDYDRNGLLTTKGLPQCKPGRLENTTTKSAQRACSKALVGTGFASGQVKFPDDQPFNASSKVLAFNGTPRHGHPVILLHAYAYVPAPTTFIVPVIITKIHKGRYGYQSVLNAPTIAGGYGVITHFNLKLDRRYTFKGKKLSFLSARCVDGRLQATGTVSFVDGSTASASVFRPCTVRK